MATIKVSKIEAARRQLRTAIRLWFSDEDPVSIHTLAAAAHQIVHDMNHAKRGPNLLLDAAFIRKDKKQEWAQLLKGPANFLKHADRGKAGSSKEIELNLFDAEMFIAMAVLGLEQMGEKLGREEIAIKAWQSIHRTELLNDAGANLLAKNVPIEVLARLRAIPKSKFLKESERLFGC